jgi:hypothetical protein
MHAGFSPRPLKDEANDGKRFPFVCDIYAPPWVELLRITAWAAIYIDHVQEPDKVHRFSLPAAPMRFVGFATG